MFKVAGIGEVLWDIHGDDKTLGGAPANFACHCGILGAHAYVVSCVGDDALGAAGRDFLQQHGVDCSGLLVAASLQTGRVQVTLGHGGQPEYEIKQHVAWDAISFTAELAGLAPRLDAVCFGSLSQRSDASRDAIGRFLDATRPDCLRMFDINLRQTYYSDAVILDSLKRANALKVNDEELPILAAMLGIPGTDSEQLKAIVRAHDMKLAVLTCGSKGAWIVTPDDANFAAAPPPTVLASTVGAGDSFTAAVVTGYLNGNTLEDINRHANTVASHVCTQLGAVPPLPPKTENGDER
ncbi:MAG TPA: carbohydrate kinase [Lentisphaeria bacterium]|nr:carbohydrate kinase [Lentisphaeria bacterium]